MDALKKFSPGFYALIIFCFFLPFINLSCSGQTIMSLSGFQLITGSEYQEPNMFGQPQAQEKEKVDSQPMALLAFLSALLALGISFARKKQTAFLTMIVSGFGAIFLLLLKINIDGDASANGQGVITVDYQFGYWFSFLLFIAGGVVQWLLFKEKPVAEVATEVNPPASE